MRLTRALPSFLFAALLLSACGPGSPTLPSTPDLPAVTETHASPPTLTPTPTPSIGVDPASLHGLSLQVWHAFAGPAYDVFTNQVAQFNAVNEWGILVKPTGCGDYTALFDAVNAALDSGQTPELLASLPEQTLTWADSGAVVDLNPYLNDPSWGLGKDAIADIPSIFWAQDNDDGKQLGLPAQRSARFLFYNETWAHELGFDSPPATADEFRQQACAANASFRLDNDVTNDGKGGWVVDSHWQTIYSWLLAFGGSVTDGTDYRFRTDQNLASLQFLKKMDTDYCAWPGETPYDSFAARSALFVSGDLAELSLEGDSMSRLKNADEWTVILFPGPQTSTVVVYGPSYTLLKATPEKQLASWLFARWLLTPENQVQWVEATGLFPLRTSLLDMVGPYRAASPQWDAAVNALSLAQGVPPLASWRKVRYVLEDGMTVIFQTNTPVDQLPSVLAEVDAMAEELNKK